MKLASDMIFTTVLGQHLPPRVDLPIDEVPRRIRRSAMQMRNAAVSEKVVIVLDGERGRGFVDVHRGYFLKTSILSQVNFKT